MYLFTLLEVPNITVLFDISLLQILLHRCVAICHNVVHMQLVGL